MIVIGSLALCASALVITAQDQGTERPTGQRPGGPGGGRMTGGPLMEALDANKDGELDATEIQNAGTALKNLDKDGDGKLSREELRPAGPRGARPGGRSPGSDN